MNGLSFERTHAERTCDRRYHCKDASRALSKQRIAACDPGRRIRVLHYRVRAARNAPLFDGPARLRSTAVALLAGLPDEKLGES